MKLVIESVSENESFARTVVAAYITRLDPTLEELADVKTAVSEAVTNSIIHGYLGKKGEIEITCEIEGRECAFCGRCRGIRGRKFRSEV